MRRMVISALGILATAAVAHGQIVYQTGFEAPPFVVGNLVGQDGWLSTNTPPTPGRGIVQSAFALGGSQAIRIDASVSSTTDWYWRNISFPVSIANAPIVRVAWDMYLDGTSPQPSLFWGIDIYDTTVPVARRVTAAVVSAQGILHVWDFTQLHNTGVAVTRDAWHHFDVDLNYAVGSRQVNVTLDGVRVVTGFAFAPSTTDSIADVDLYNVDGNGTDAAFFDNLSVAASGDSDVDGVYDVYDLCPGTPAGIPVDFNGCADLDEDGVGDALDLCPNTAAGEPVDASGCSTVDTDGDGVNNDADACPATPLCATVGAIGCPSDSDGDTVLNGCDNCPSVANGPAQDNQSDVDGDGDGDVCDTCPTRRPADVTGDGSSNGQDVGAFVSLLLNGGGSAEERCAADLNVDLSIDLADLPLFTTALLGS